MVVSINGGTAKWLVYKGQSHLEMDILRIPLFQETSIYTHTMETSNRQRAATRCPISAEALVQEAAAAVEGRRVATQVHGPHGAETHGNHD